MLLEEYIQRLPQAAAVTACRAVYTTDKEGSLTRWAKGLLVGAHRQCHLKMVMLPLAPSCSCLLGEALCLPVSLLYKPDHRVQPGCHVAPRPAMRGHCAAAP